MKINKHIDYEQKLIAVTGYLQGQISQFKVSAKYGVKQYSLQTWLRKYYSEGADGVS